MTLTEQQSGRQSFGLGVVLVLSLMVSAFPMFALSVLAPFITEDLDIGRAALGGLTSVVFATAVLFSTRVGLMTDTVDVRRLLGAQFLVGALTSVVMATAVGYGLLVVGAMLGGVALAFGIPLSTKIVQQQIPAHLQAVLIGVSQSGAQLTALLSGSLLPVAAVALGWRPTLLSSVALCAAGALLGLRFVRPTRPSGSKRPAADDPHRRETRTMAGHAFLLNLVMFTTLAYLPLYGYERLGMSVTRAGLLTSLVAVCSISGKLIWGRVVDRGRPLRGVYVMVTVLGALAIALIALSPYLNRLVIWPAVALFGATITVWGVLSMFAVSQRGPGSGRAAGTVMAAAYVGSTIGPFGFGLVVDRTGSYGPAWSATLVLAGLAILGSATITGRAPDTARVA